MVINTFYFNILQSCSALKPQASAFRVFNLRNYSTTHEADLVVIGAGPGGYVASIKAAQMGMKVS